MSGANNPQIKMKKSNKHPRKWMRHNLSVFLTNGRSRSIPVQCFLYIKVKRNSVKWYYDYMVLSN
nr:MAG TPA: hypothetical protein [Crassvirales sp.]